MGELLRYGTPASLVSDLMARQDPSTLVAETGEAPLAADQHDDLAIRSAEEIPEPGEGRRVLGTTGTHGTGDGRSVAG